MATKTKAAAKKPAAPRKAKGAKVATPKDEKSRRANYSAGAIRSWENKSVAASRSARHKVKVGGEEYRSVMAAFKALELPLAKHQKFRKELKEKGQMKFEGHTFKIVS